MLLLPAGEEQHRASKRVLEPKNMVENAGAGLGVAVGEGCSSTVVKD
jgi:hypothetical protein